MINAQMMQYAFENNLYICTYSKIYRVFWSNAQHQMYLSETLISTNKHIAKRGSCVTLSANQINSILGFRVLNGDVITA